MQIRQLAIEGAFEITPDLHPDDRGVFTNPYVASAFTAAIGHPFAVAQTNHSVSRRGVVRGVHYALAPGQAKYVYCPHGSALDVVVDIRVGSPTFGRYDVVGLDAGSARAVYLDETLGHLLIALEDVTVAHYLCSTAYDPAREFAINPLDPALGIELPAEGDAVLSERDRAAPTLAQARERGLLPAYAGLVSADGPDAR